MRKARKYRFYLVLLISVGVAVALALVLYALRQNIQLYWTPSQLNQQLQSKNQALYTQTFRLGGVVKPGSVHFAKQGIGVHFIIWDFQQALPVFYHGILPTLFKEGRGVIAQGVLDKKGVFVADEVLAKHDENYSPLGVDTKRS